MTTGQPGGAFTPEQRRELPAAAGPLEDPAARPAPLNGLLAAESLRCNFHEGLNITQTNSGKVGAGAMVYQGGEVQYQDIDLEGERAEMLGHITGLLEGSVKVRTSATNAGIHFYGFRAKHGEFVVTTVYAVKNPAGNYLAVMSVHDTAFQQSAFMTNGTCEVVLTRP